MENNNNNNRRNAIITGVALGGLIGLIGYGISRAWNRAEEENPEEQEDDEHVADYVQRFNNLQIPNDEDALDEYVKRIPINSLLQDIHTYFVAIREEDFARYFGVFKEAFQNILDKMYSISPYFDRYGRQFQYSGSHSDNLKIGLPNEFDMNVIIRVPISNKLDVKLQTSEAGFVMVKLNEKFPNLPRQPDWDTHHNVTAGWVDSENYLLQDKIRNWIESLFQQALNEQEKNWEGQPIVKVDNIPYSIKIIKSGPAYTIRLKTSYYDDFCLDVDFVPVFQFELDQLPPNFRQYQPTVELRENSKNIFVVPKPMKKSVSEALKSRSWRVSFHEQEKEIMHGTYTMRSTIRLIKKMRDNLNMKNLSSYFIKTLFLWENENAGEGFWNQNPVFLLNHMLKKLHTALVSKSIRYYWDPRYNLLETLENKIQGYDVKVKSALVAIEVNDNVKLTKCFLNDHEYRMFKTRREPSYV